MDADRDVGLRTMLDPTRRPSAGAIIQDQYDIDAPWHHHDMHQLQYAFEGAMELEDDHGRHLLPRCLAGWIPAGTRHRNSLHHIHSVSILLSPEQVVNGGDRVRILNVSPLLREMVAEAARWPIGRPLDATGRAFFAAFACLCEEWITDRAKLTLPSTADTLLGRALANVRSDPARSDIRTSACAAGVSERTLRRRCQAQIGMGWGEYRRRARLLAAIERLTETNHSIACIAADVGFESQSAFARAFRQLMGQSPQSFRMGRTAAGELS
ncbi:MAG TPA: helix-turn-helix transcriptional regulator [Novosphingobium sp.]|nr:helix-turn-helix transcriptional regulator [Novosphingobium sp.]